MHHDSTLLVLPGPKRHKIAGVREAHTDLTHRKLETMGEAIPSDVAYSSNEVRQSVWRITLLIKVALLT